MISFLLKLQKGVKKETLSKKELKFLFELTKSKTLKDANFLELPHDLLLGAISTPKDSKDRKKIGFLKLFGTRRKDLIVDELNGAKNGDIVLAKYSGKRRGRESASVVHIVKSKNIITIAVLLFDTKKARVVDINTEETIHLKLKQKELKELPDQTVLAVDQHSGEIKEILGVLSDPKVDEDIVLSRFERSDYFSAEILQEVKSFDGTVDKSLYPDRADLTHIPFATIDPVDAKDYDDAIFFDSSQNKLFVAIADVTSYVHTFGHIDSEAKKRGFSIYLPHKSIPMLPRELSENLCSLKPDQARLAFVCELTLDQDLNISDQKFYEAIIKSHNRFSYEFVDELFENDKKDDLLWLFELKDLTQNLRRKRLKKGFSFYNPEIKLHLDQKLVLTDTTKAKETISNQLIEECMLLANIAAANYFDFGIFRTHEPPEYSNILALIEMIKELDIEVTPRETVHKTIEEIQKEAKKSGFQEEVDKLIIKSLKRAAYTYDNVGHFGLGFDKYTHFTAPIRRYSDLLLHRYLKAIISGEKKTSEHIRKSLEEVAPVVSDLEMEVSKIEWQYADRVYARWAKRHLGEVLEATIFDEVSSKKDVVATTTDEKLFGMRVYIPWFKKQHQVLGRFSVIKVEIVDVNLISAKVFVRVVGYV